MSSVRDALRRGGAAAAVGLLLLLAPRLAAACSACFVASDARVARMFVVTAALLSVLPFAIVGGIAWWSWRRVATGAGA